MSAMMMFVSILASSAFLTSGWTLKPGLESPDDGEALARLMLALQPTTLSRAGMQQRTRYHQQQSHVSMMAKRKKKAPAENPPAPAPAPEVKAEAEAPAPAPKAKGGGAQMKALDSALKTLNDQESLEILARVNCYPITDPAIVGAMIGKRTTKKVTSVLELFLALQSGREKKDGYAHIMKHVGDMNVKALGADIKKQWEESDIKEPAVTPDEEELGAFVLALTKALEKDNGLSDGKLSGPSSGLDELPSGPEFKKVFEEASKKSPAITSITEQVLVSQVPSVEGADVRSIRFSSLSTALGQAITSMYPKPIQVEVKQVELDPNDFEAPPAEVLEIEISTEFANAMKR